MSVSAAKALIVRANRRHPELGSLFSVRNSLVLPEFAMGVVRLAAVIESIVHQHQNGFPSLFSGSAPPRGLGALAIKLSARDLPRDARTTPVLSSRARAHSRLCARETGIGALTCAPARPLKWSLRGQALASATMPTCGSSERLSEIGELRLHPRPQ